MHNTLPLSRGLDDALTAIRECRERVEAFVRAHRHLHPGELIAVLRAELGNGLPTFTAALQTGMLAAWLGGAVGPARDALPEPAGSPLPPLPLPPPPPAGLEPSPDDVPRPPRLRFPMIEAGIRELTARGAITPGESLGLLTDAKDTAETVARVVAADAVGAVRAAVADDLARGGGLRNFRKTVGPLLDSAGLNDREIETLYRTQTAQARSAGTQAVLANPVIGSEFPYAAWHATHDARVRPDHLRMEVSGIQGTNIYRTDDPILKKYWPPAGYNCRCIVRLLSLEEAAARGIYEARRWLATGEPPAEPAWVPDPGLKLPRDWPTGGQLAPVIR